MNRYRSGLLTKVVTALKIAAIKKILVKYGAHFFCVAMLLTQQVAQSNTVAGTDLIYLIDQSGSMSAQGATRIANDRDGKRVQALRALMGHLMHSSISGYTNRISVIEFGGRHAKDFFFRPQKTLDRLFIPPLAPGESVTTVQQIIDNGLLPVSKEHRGDTDHPDALDKANEELAYFTQTPPVAMPGSIQGKRNQLIIMITDGQPSVARADKNFRMSVRELTSEIELHVQRLNTLSKEATFVVFGFNDKGSKYWKNHWGEFWKKQASIDPSTGIGHAYLLNPPDQAVSNAITKIGEIASELIQPALKATSNDSYIAPPYLKEMQLTIDFFVPGLPVSAINIYDPTGVVVPTSKIKASNGYATATIPHPMPGVWRLRQGNDRYRVKVLPVYEIAQLQTPKGTMPQYTNTEFSYKLTGSGDVGQFSPQKNLPPVNFHLKLVAPSGVTKTFNMTLDEQTGVVSSQSYDSDEAGVYKLSLTGETIAADGATAAVYSAQNSYVVNSATPVTLELMLPAKSDTFTLSGGKAIIPVTFLFRHAYTKKVVPPVEVLKSGQNLQVAFRPDLNQSQRRDVPMPKLSTLKVDNEQLKAQVQVDFGPPKLSEYFAVRAIRFELQPLESHLKADVSYLGMADSSRVLLTETFTVKESWLGLWPWLLGGLALLVVFGLMLFRLFLPLLISRSDSKYKRAPRLSYMPSNTSNYNKEWKLKGVRVFKQPTSVTLATGQTWQILKFKIVRKWKAGSVVEVVIYYQKKGQKGRAERLVLSASDDFGTGGARGRIIGMGNNESAEFVLFTGSTRN